MLQLIIWGFLAFTGAQMLKLRWQHFAWIFGGAMIATALQSMMNSANRLNPGASNLFEPEIFLVNWLVGGVTWSIFFLGGYGFGKFRRRNK